MAFLEINFLDVGQGDGTFFIFPDNETTMLVDFGSKFNMYTDRDGDVKNNIDALTYVLAALKKINPNKNKIDHIFITHPDGDHYNLLPKLVEKGINFGQVYIGGEQDDYKKLHTAIKKAIKIKNGAMDVDGSDEDSSDDENSDEENSFIAGWYKFASAACDDINTPYLTIEDVKIYVLGVNNAVQFESGDKRSIVSTDANAKSIVLRIEYGGKVLIMPGDAEEGVEQKIVQQNYLGNHAFLKCDVLKLGHHGSESATKKEWIDALQPKAIFASSDRRWSHPYKNVLDRFKKNKNNDVFDGNVNYLWKWKEHDFLCGTGKHDNYTSFTVKTCIFTNLISDGGKEDDGSMSDDDSHVVKGTQYTVQFSNDGKIFIGDMDDSLEITSP